LCAGVIFLTYKCDDLVDGSSFVVFEQELDVLLAAAKMMIERPFGLARRSGEVFYAKCGRALRGKYLQALLQPDGFRAFFA